MKDFESQLLAGVQAAKDAYANKEEIAGIFNEIDELLSNLYKGKVRFAQVTGSRPVKSNRKSRGLLDSLNVFDQEYEDFSALAILDHALKNPIYLADLFLSENGYPCTIIVDGYENYCTNKDDLKSALSSLLGNVKTGKAIIEKEKKYNES